MVIQHNMTAVSANSYLSKATNNLASSTEKLSSGYRINSAADDAAGLSISEKMRSQIRGLDQASTNAQDGISLTQTAEGALEETTNILQRMRELSVQAANGTETDDDREAIQDEVNQLQSEIDRIATTTEFNTKSLLDGSFSTTFQIGANSGQTMSLSISSMNTANLGLITGTEISTTATDFSALDDDQYTLSDGNVLDTDGATVGTYDDSTGVITLTDSTTIDLGHSVTDGSTLSVSDGEGTFKLATDSTKSVSSAVALTAGDYSVNSDGQLLEGSTVLGTIDGTTLTYTSGSAKGSTVDLSYLGLDEDDLASGESFTVKGIDVSTTEGASSALDTIDAAISAVTKQRSALGAVENRLEYTISNLDTSSENLQTAESRIRDVDMADEMVTYSNQSIIQQAAQSMLAQANQSNQGVLSLLQ